MRHMAHLGVAILLTWLLAIGPATAEDWPMFRHDREFMAATSEKLSPPLDRIWVFRARQSRYAPLLKGNPLKEFTPEQNRHALCITAAGDSLFFTSAADGRVVCLDAATAKMRWEFIAGSSVNRPPTYFDGKVYAGSDDGHVYCLDAKTGKPVWTWKPVSADRWLIAYNQLTSVWPIRTNILIDEGVAYLGVGTFPHDGTFIVALDPKTGRILWNNGAHCETTYRWAISPTGNLYATEKNLYVPNDVKPFRWAEFNSFRRTDGSHDEWGGSDPKCPVPGQDLVTLAGAVRDNRRYLGNAAQTITWTKQEHGKNVANFANVWSVLTPGYALETASMAGHVPMRGAPLMYNPDLCPVILTDSVVYSLRCRPRGDAGVDGKVFAHAAADGKELWSAEIGEWPDQVIAANGRLFVSTRCGTIYAFAPAGATPSGVVEEAVDGQPFSQEAPLADVARSIVEKSGISEGYAIVLDCTTGVLAAELAKQTKLNLVAVFDHAAKAEAARAAYSRANLHVCRIAVWHRSGSAGLPLPPFFADLIVSEAAARGGELPRDVEAVQRLLKPIRGVALFGGQGTTQEAASAWIKQTKQADWQVVAGGGHWAVHRRPHLEGAGGWTHEEGDAGNTMCSNDEVLKPPLGVVWFGRPFTERGSRGITPSILGDGVLIKHTTSDLDKTGYTQAFDQYTGRLLWHHAGEVTDTVAARGAIFQRYAEVVDQLDPWTGKAVRQHVPPFPGGRWEKMAADRNGRTLYLRAAGEDDGTKKKWSCCLAIDVAPGTVRWQLGGPGREEQWDGWAAISDGRIYFTQGEPNDAERAEARADMLARLKDMPGDEYKEFAAAIDKHSFMALTAMDAETGKVLYRKAVNNTNAGGAWTRQVVSGGRRQYEPHLLGCVIANGGAVVIATQAGADKSWAVWPNGGYKGRAISVYDGATGKLLWYQFGNYRARPVVTKDLVVAEPWAFDLRTGAPKMRVHPVTGEQVTWAFCRYGKQCGTFNGSRYMLFGRSTGIGYHDLLTDQGLYTFLHSRADCWIDTSSGGGTMVKPPDALDCKCEVSMPFTVALAQVPTPPATPQMFGQPGPSLPVKHLYLDLGATGDRRDVHGRLWLTNERVKGLLMLAYPVETVLCAGGGAVRRSALHTSIENTDVPFVFATALRGLRKCTVPLAESGTARYTVRLGFSAMPGDKPGQRLFDVKLDDQVVLRDFDIVRETGASDRAVWKEFAVSAGKALTIELVPKVDQPTPEQMPLISGLQVERRE